MGTLLAKALLLFAMLLMPFGMSPAAAAPAHVGGHASMNADHCAGKASDRHSGGGIVDCTMACASALPATTHPYRPPLLIAPQRVAPATVLQLTGLHPETATPPPRPS